MSKPSMVANNLQIGDADDLAYAIRRAHDEPDALTAMGAQGRRSYEAHYTAEQNYGLIMRIYEQAIQKKSTAP